MPFPILMRGVWPSFGASGGSDNSNSDNGSLSLDTKYSEKLSAHALFHSRWHSPRLLAVTVRDKALEQLSDVNQRQLIDELAGVSALDDNHPVWALVARLGVVVGSATTDTAAEVALLRDEVIELKGLMQWSLGRNGSPAQDSRALLVELSETMNQVKLVLADAAQLNRQMPKFLDRLEEVLVGTRQAIAAIDRKLDGIISLSTIR